MIPRHLQITLALLLLAVLSGTLYLAHLKSRAEQEPNATDAPVAEPISGPKQKINVLIAYDDDQTFRTREIELAMPTDPAARAQAVVRGLLREYMQKPSPHPVPQGSDVREVFLLPDGTCVVDLNGTFADGHSSGVLLEEFSVASLVESIAMNVPEVKQVKFIVDGKERATLAGHADLSAPYDLQAVKDLVQQMQ